MTIPALLIVAVCRTHVLHEPWYGAAHHESFVAQWFECMYQINISVLEHPVSLYKCIKLILPTHIYIYMFFFFVSFAFFSLELWLVRLSNIFVLRFTVALPLIFPCVFMIIFCSNYLTDKPNGFSWASSPWEFKWLDFFFALYNLWQTKQ